MKKVTFVKERWENMFGKFESIDTITGEIVNQESDEETVYVKVWNKLISINMKDVISIE